MRNSHVRHLLATWRELDDETRVHVEEHLSTCNVCRAERQAFREQDILLGSLPTVRPRPAWQHQVRARIHANPCPRRLRVSQQAGLLVAVLVIFAAMSVGTVAVSAEALPGDFLYPVKRTVEQVNLIVIHSDEREQEYQSKLSERRREEARRVLELKRQVAVQFSGQLAQDSQGQWVIDDIPVQVDLATIADAGLEAGDMVEIDGMALSGEMRVLRITERHQQQESPTPRESAPSETPTSRPALPPTLAEPTEEAGPMPTSTDRPARPTNTPRPTIERTITRPPLSSPVAPGIRGMVTITVTRTPRHNEQATRIPLASPIAPGLRATVTVTRTPRHNVHATRTPLASPVAPGIRRTVTITVTRTRTPLASPVAPGIRATVTRTRTPQQNEQPTRTPHYTRTPHTGAQPGATATITPPPTRTLPPIHPGGTRTRPTHTPAPTATPNTPEPVATPANDASPTASAPATETPPASNDAPTATPIKPTGETPPAAGDTPTPGIGLSPPSPTPATRQ
jgi:hypothetical protein